MRYDAFWMSSPLISGHPSFDIDAEIGLADAVVATLWPPRVRAIKFAVGYPILGYLSWTGPLVYDVFFWSAVFLMGGTYIAIAIITGYDYKKAGGKPKRMQFHVCATGIEVRDGRWRREWLSWGELESVRETPISFLIRPSDVEQYVIPKRACRGDLLPKMRDALRRCYQPAKALASAKHTGV